MTKEMQLQIKLMSVRKMLASSEGTREEIGQSIQDFLEWYKSDDNALNRKQDETG